MKLFDKLFPKVCSGKRTHRFILQKHIRGIPYDPTDLYVCKRCGMRKIVYRING